MGAFMKETTVVKGGSDLASHRHTSMLDSRRCGSATMADCNHSATSLGGRPCKQFAVFENRKLQGYLHPMWAKSRIW